MADKQLKKALGAIDAVNAKVESQSKRLSFMQIVTVIVISSLVSVVVVNHSKWVPTVKSSVQKVVDVLPIVGKEKEAEVEIEVKPEIVE